MGGAHLVLGARIRVPRVNALVRDRLDDQLRRIWDHRFGLVVAPAGSGKTTLLAHFAGRAAVPVAWYRAEASDSSKSAVLGHLLGALNESIGPLPGSWTDIETAISALETWKGSRALLVIDDLHELLGTDAERTIEKFLEYVPHNLHILAASRRPPDMNLPRLRVSSELLEVTPDDLRFRSWEVEQLFRNFYGEPLPPEDLAELTRRTEGWAAGLQLFHLATTGKSASERRKAVAALGKRWKLVGEYLARNVLDDLPEELRTFLLETCVLGRLTGELCDELLEAQGSHALLEELERRQIFTYAIDDQGTFRYHEALRSYLESMLVERMGEPEAHLRHRRAGAILERAGLLTDALHAYCRAEAWESVARLTGSGGEKLVEEPGAWIRALPPALLEQDPWLILAQARYHLSCGDLAAATDVYRKAERTFGASAAADICRNERLAIVPWIERVPGPPTHWTGLIRAATRRDPILVAHKAAAAKGPSGRIAQGIALLLAGHIRRAQAQFVEAAEDIDVGDSMAIWSQLGLMMVSLLRGEEGSASTIEDLAGHSERLGIPWLARISRCLLGMTDRAGGVEEAASSWEASRRYGDFWGGALALLLEGAALLRAGESPIRQLEVAAEEFRELGAGVLAAWANAMLSWAMARDSHIEARAMARQAETQAKTTGAQGAQMLASTVLAALDVEKRNKYLSHAQELAEECEIDLALLIRRHGGQQASWFAGSSNEAPERLSIRCFGGFGIAVGGSPVDLREVKPRARSALRLLAMHSGRPVHRESLIEALWPSGSEEAGTRNLHVAISALRHVIEPGATRGNSTFILREGDAYRLAIPEAGACDVLDFEEALSNGRSARAIRDFEKAANEFERALDLYAGDLLPEDGPAEWAVPRREAYRAEAVEASQASAEVFLELNRPEAAAAVCERGLRIDRFRDELWRLLFDAYERAGDRASAAKSKREYELVLNELGVASESGA